MPTFPLGVVSICLVVLTAGLPAFADGDPAVKKAAGAVEAPAVVQPAVAPLFTPGALELSDEAARLDEAAAADAAAAADEAAAAEGLAPAALSTQASRTRVMFGTAPNLAPYVRIGFANRNAAIRWDNLENSTDMDGPMIGIGFRYVTPAGAGNYGLPDGYTFGVEVVGAELAWSGGTLSDGTAVRSVTSRQEGLLGTLGYATMIPGAPVVLFAECGVGFLEYDLAFKFPNATGNDLHINNTEFAFRTAIGFTVRPVSPSRWNHPKNGFLTRIALRVQGEYFWADRFKMQTSTTTVGTYHPDYWGISAGLELWF